MDVLVEGKKLQGWGAVTIEKSLENLSGAFSISTADTQTPQGLFLPIFPDDRIRVRDDSDIFINGYVDRIVPKVGASEHSISAIGRDLTCDLVDCTITNGPKWKNVRLDRLVSELCKPFGITVIADADMGEAFTAFAAEPGETVFDAITRACRFRSVLPTSDFEGRLVLTKIGSLQSDDELVLGSNIAMIQGNYDNSDRYSEITVVGQRPAQANTTAEKAYKIKATATDPDVKRFRPLRIVAGQQIDTAGAQRRANWEVTTRAGKANSITITANEWRQSSGRLWQPNMIVPVTAGYLGLDKVDMLISTCSYSLSNSGQPVVMNLVRPDAYLQIPPSLKKTSGKPDLWASVRKDVRGE